MFILAVLTLIFGLVHAVDEKTSAYCTFDLFAVRVLPYSKTQYWRHLGALADTSTESIKQHIHNTVVPHGSRDSPETRYRYDFHGSCTIPSGWTMVSIKSSFVVLFFEVRTSKIRNLQGATEMNILLRVRFPEDFDSWTLDLNVIPQAELAKPTTLLQNFLPVTFFPKPGLEVEQITREGMSDSVPSDFPGNYTCLLELRRSTLYPRSDSENKLPPYMKLEYSEPDSEWKVVGINDVNALGDLRDPMDAFKYNLSRIYAKNKPGTCYRYKGVNEGSYWYYVGVASG